jgi:hypothetical protein
VIPVIIGATGTVIPVIIGATGTMIPVIIRATGTVIPGIIRATGTFSQSLRQYLSKIPGKHEIKELQKTAILGTAHILRKALTYFTGKITLHAAQIVNTEQLQHYTP